MGSRMVRFNFKPKENEQIEAVVKLPKEPRSVIHGVVKDHNNNLVKDAVVKLFKIENPNKKCKLIPLTHTFTDECGQFLFGPLTPCIKYAIKVWVDNTEINQLVVSPDECCDSDDNDCGCDEEDCDDEDFEKYYEDK